MSEDKYKETPPYPSVQRASSSGPFLPQARSQQYPSSEAARRFAGKQVTVVGVAREGLSLVRFLTRVGAKVTANDRAASLPEPAASLLSELGVPAVLGGHPEELFLSSDAVFVSPGVPQQLPVLAATRGAGIPVSSETQLFFELCRGAIVGITGSSGKTTTTALTGEMIRRAGLPVHVGGNIGTPLLEEVDEIAPDHWVVLEMSSFQLETLPYSPSVAAVLNITPNHLDRHPGMDAYVAAKMNILLHQKPGDKVILNADDPVGSSLDTLNSPVWFSLEREVDGSFVQGDRIVVGHSGAFRTVCDLSDVRLRGRHNLANVAAAVAIGSSIGLAPETMREAIVRFTGVPHRLEIVASIDGVIYCNDSIATAPERAIASLRSFEQPVVLIAGGRNKRLPMDGWARLIRERVKAVVVMGEAAGEIEEAIQSATGGSLPPIERASDLDQAVRSARKFATPGDVVLLAPGCTSFDLFKDFEERGERFRLVVNSLRPSGEATR